MAEGGEDAVMVKDETIAQRYKALWQQAEQRYRVDYEVRTFYIY